MGKATTLLKVTFILRTLLVSAHVRAAWSQPGCSRTERIAAMTPPSIKRSLPVDESTVGTHQVGSGCADLVGRAATSCSGDLDHLR